MAYAEPSTRCSDPNQDIAFIVRIKLFLWMVEIFFCWSLLTSGGHIAPVEVDLSKLVPAGQTAPGHCRDHGGPPQYAVSDNSYLSLLFQMQQLVLCIRGNYNGSELLKEVNIEFMSVYGLSFNLLLVELNYFRHTEEEEFHYNLRGEVSGDLGAVSVVLEDSLDRDLVIVRQLECSDTCFLSHTWKQNINLYLLQTLSKVHSYF